MKEKSILLRDESEGSSPGESCWVGPIHDCQNPVLRFRPGQVFCSTKEKAPFPPGRSENPAGRRPQRTGTLLDWTFHF